MYYLNYNLKIDGEIWTPVLNHEKNYEVSSFGRVKRLKGKRCLTDRIIKQNICTSGRLQVKLSTNNIKYPMQVHRLVAIHFLKNSDNLPMVLHIDDNPKNNVVGNLKWGTQKENIQDCHKKGRAAKNFPVIYKNGFHPSLGKKLSVDSKKKISNAKIKIPNSTLQAAIEEAKLRILSIRAVARKYKISSSYLVNLLNGKATRLKFIK